MAGLIVGFKIKDVTTQSFAGIIDGQVAEAISTSTHINAIWLRIEYKALPILLDMDT